MHLNVWNCPIRMPTWIVSIWVNCTSMSPSWRCNGHNPADIVAHAKERPPSWKGRRTCAIITMSVKWTQWTVKTWLMLGHLITGCLQLERDHLRHQIKQLMFICHVMPSVQRRCPPIKWSILMAPPIHLYRITRYREYPILPANCSAIWILCDNSMRRIWTKMWLWT